MTQHYRAHLEHQIAAVEQFIELMPRERTLLTSEGLAIGALVDVTEAKQAMAARLERMESERLELARSIAAEAGVAADDHAAVAEHAGVGELWLALRGRASAAREANEHNGEAIHTRLAHNDQALAAMRRANPPSMYAADGQRHGAGTNRIRSGA